MNVNFVLTVALLVGILLGLSNAKERTTSNHFRGSTTKEADRNLQSSVECGGHSATSCSHCTFDDNLNFRGAAWCNGDCTWEHDSILNDYEGTISQQCRPKKTSDVDCGLYASRGESRPGMFRATCGDCLNPFFDDSSKSGVTHCGGDCEMDGDECIARLSVEDYLQNPNATVSIRNLKTSRYIAQIGDRIEMEELPSPGIPAALWNFEQEDCPSQSIARQQGRACYSLRNIAVPDAILGTNGASAFRHDPPANILSVFTIEEDDGCTTLGDAAQCRVNLQVSFYGDIHLADTESDQSVYQNVPIALTQISGDRLPTPSGEDSTWQLLIFQNNN